MRYKPGESSIPGLRERRRSKITGTVVSIYDTGVLEAGVEEDERCPERWAVRCEDHGETLGCSTLADARSRLAACEWCSGCQDATGSRHHDVAGSQHARCCGCGQKIKWQEEHSNVGNPLCDEVDAVLFNSGAVNGTRLGDGNGVYSSARIYCVECAPRAIRARCAQCSSADADAATLGRLATRATLSALATGAELSVLSASPPGPIEVVDVATLPEPPAGSWAAKLREELLGARKGEN